MVLLTAAGDGALRSGGIMICSGALWRSSSMESAHRQAADHVALRYPLPPFPRCDIRGAAETGTL